MGYATLHNSGFLNTHPETCEMPEGEIRALKMAVSLLEQRIDSPPEVSEIARAVGLSERRLQYVFTTVYGMTIKRAVRRRRLELAADEIRKGKAIKGVAAHYGYSSVSAFTYAFRKSFGVPPAEWFSKY